jgi:hypothetical protein
MRALVQLILIHTLTKLQTIESMVRRLYEQVITQRTFWPTSLIEACQMGKNSILEVPGSSKHAHEVT